MNKLLLTTLSAGVLAMAATSMAQPANSPDDHSGRDQNRPAAAQGARGQHGPANGQANRARPGAGAGPNRPAAQTRPGFAQPNRPAVQTRPAITRPGRENQVGRPNTRPGQPSHMTRPNTRPTTTPPRVQTRDLSRYRANVSATRRYHYTRPYVRPSGWYARRWTYGQRFPRAWYGQQYWITNFIAYGLFGPPPGYEWVRYGDDALLVNLATGTIIRVEYGLFY